MPRRCWYVGPQSTETPALAMGRPSLVFLPGLGFAVISFGRWRICGKSNPVRTPNSSVSPATLARRSSRYDALWACPLSNRKSWKILFWTNILFNSSKTIAHKLRDFLNEDSTRHTTLVGYSSNISLEWRHKKRPGFEMVVQKRISIDTSGHGQMQDITNSVASIVRFLE